MQNLINLTPHTINIYKGVNLLLSIESVGNARATQTAVELDPLFIDGIDIPVSKVTFGDTIDLPEYDPSNLLIVSIITAQAALANGRCTDDLYVPTGMVRKSAADGKISSDPSAIGQIIGCTGLSKF